MIWNVGVENSKVVDWVTRYVVDSVSAIIKCKIMLKFKDLNYLSHSDYVW